MAKLLICGGFDEIFGGSDRLAVTNVTSAVIVDGDEKSGESAFCIGDALAGPDRK